MSRVRIATRGSKLALWQAEHVGALLRQAEPDLEVELIVLKTTGDKVLDRPLHDVGGKGLFTKEIEEALLDGRAEVAVHSMKDLPGEEPAGLCIAAVPRREDPRDGLLLKPALRKATSPGEGPLDRLPGGAHVGTTSLRRVCQLRRLRPDLRIEPLRGNVDTRLRRLDAGEMDAILLAVAGLARLGHAARIDVVLPTSEFVPAVGQGALAVQCRVDDQATCARLGRLEDPASRTATTAERAFLQRLAGSCKTPLGAHGTLAGATLHLDGFIGHPDGHPLVRAQLQGPAEEAEALGRALAEQLLTDGGAALLRELG